MAASPIPLPIDEVLDELVEVTRSAGASVLVAPPGAGKTTRVPPALVRAGLGPVIVVEPRRIAARAAARRVAAETGWKPKDEVGYHVRFDKQVGPSPKILFCTEGILLARLQADPFLEGVGCILFDEFHERRLDADLALAMARRVQLDVRDDLRLIVTSATLDPAQAAAFLGDAPVVESEGQLHPVETRFLPRERAQAGARHGRGEFLEDHVARGVRTALDDTDGDVLVFLPGVGEIRRAESRLARVPGIDVRPLYGDLSPEQQDAALRKGSRRRVVLATNVAESSVTVEGVRAVVDSGEARVMRHDAGAGVDQLRVERIDRAAADQRRGRAGRVGPGLCIRLWSGLDDRTLDPHLAPEVRRLDVAGAALQLIAWGEADPAAFPWYEAPRPEVLAAGMELLRSLGALDNAGRITPHGRAIARMPLSPRMAALVLDGAARGAAELSALCAAMLSERDPFQRGHGGPRPDAADSDVLERCIALEDFERSKRTSSRGLEVVPAGARSVLRVRDQVLRSIPRGGKGGGHGAAKKSHGEPGDDEEGLARALLAAFGDRLCRRRSDDTARAVMAGGRGVRLAPECAVTEAELFVAIRTTAGRKRGDEDIVRLASAVEREWVDGGEVKVTTRPVFDPKSERVVGRRREMLGPLVLAESDHPLGKAADVEEVLVEAASRDVSHALGLDRPAIAQPLERLRFLRHHRPDMGFPEPSEAAFGALLPMLAPGCRSFADLRRAPVLSVFLGGLTHAQRVALDKDAPERIQVPSGSRIALAYDGDRAPVLAVRIQEMFGLAETPRIAGGVVPVLLHLLAPNGRPQQVTGDLASFWREAYHQVRKDLRARYPKHPWPEDPLTAPPTARARRRRRRS